MSVKPFSAGHTLESLRDSDFDSCSAIGEVIDNSIQAGAGTIRVTFNLINNDKIKNVIFSDDGLGMTQEVIQNCLRLGWSSRYNDRSGIGRFGVGMTLGAIHECRRIEVYSKVKDADWFYTYLDLDDIEKHDSTEKDWEIPTPILKYPTLEDNLLSHLPKEQGTIVIWSKYDRARDKPKILVEQLRIWLGRTYRYFIWNEQVTPGKHLRKIPLSIFLNGNEVKAIDPLYLRKSKTDFPEDPSAKIFDDLVFNWPILDPKIVEVIGTEEAKIRVKLTLLPEEWRAYAGAGASEESKKRYIHLNEGFSFVRHGREVGYDWIPHFKFASDEKDRFWGCEIHFEPCLDQSFQVKNIKRGAVPSTDLKKAIADKVGPWIKKQREEISEHWKRKFGETKLGVESPIGSDAHSRSEKIASKAGVPQGKITQNINQVEVQTKTAMVISNQNQEEAARWVAKFASQPFTIGELAWPGSTFVDIHFMGGSDALMYNIRHVFFEVLSTIKKEVREGKNLQDNAERVTVLIDMLLLAYAKSESMLDPNVEMKPADLIDHLKSYWGQYLKTYITTWKEEFDSDI